MMDLFEMLGMEPEPMKEPKKAEPKKAAVKTSATGTKDAKKDTKKAEKKDDFVNFPVNVVTGYCDTITYQKSDFDKEQVTAKEVFEKFTSEQPSFPKSLCGYYAKRKDTVVVYVKKSFASNKATIKATKDTRYLLGGTTLDLSVFMTDPECEVDGAALIEAFQKEYPKYGAVKICYSITENTVIPCFTESKLYGNIALPVDVVFWNHEEFTVTEDDLAKSADEDTSVDNADEDEDDGEPEAKSAVRTAEKVHSSINANSLLGIVESRFPEVKGMVDICYNKETKSAIVVMKESGSAAPEKKVRCFPTDADVSIFVHIRFKLQPDWFEGKAEITEEDFKKFLEDRYPEFSAERTIVNYDEKRKLIMPILKSSSKGALSVAYTEEEEEKLKAFPFPFVREYEDGSQYRVETTPVADFRICMKGNGEKSSFIMKLPKIPKTLIVAAKEFFYKIYREKGTEAFLQLFYDDVDESYFWYLPKQVAAAGAVHAERNPKMESEFHLVADFHSHGRYSAFWSEQDCTDEKGTRIFGVMGGFDQRFAVQQRCCIRIGCGGYFLPVLMGEVVDSSDVDAERLDEVVDFLMKRKDKITVGQLE